MVSLNRNAGIRGVSDVPISRSLQPPWLAQCFGSQTIRLFVIDERVRFVVVFDLAIQRQGDIGGVTRDMRVASRIGVAFGFRAGFNAVEEIADVERRRITADFFHGPTSQ